MTAVRLLRYPSAMTLRYPSAMTLRETLDERRRAMIILNLQRLLEVAQCAAAELSQDPIVRSAAPPPPRKRAQKRRAQKKSRRTARKPATAAHRLNGVIEKRKATRTS